MANTNIHWSFKNGPYGESGEKQGCTISYFSLKYFELSFEIRFFQLRFFFKIRFSRRLLIGLRSSCTLSDAGYVDDLWRTTDILFQVFHAIFLDLYFEVRKFSRAPFFKVAFLVDCEFDWEHPLFLQNLAAWKNYKNTCSSCVTHLTFFYFTRKFLFCLSVCDSKVFVCLFSNFFLGD